MKIQQRLWKKEKWKDIKNNMSSPEDANLVFAFTSKKALESVKLYDVLKNEYPNATILMGTTAGEISDIEVFSESVSVTAIQFEKTSLKVFYEDVTEDNEALGTKISENLADENLRHIFLMSDGLKVNGTELIKGINEKLPEGVSVTGGLSGDGADFSETLVGLNEEPVSGKVAAIGLYGDSINVSYASKGGWERFGIKRKVTKSEANVLYEIDNEPALDLYKTYLGDQANELPSSALLFPLEISDESNDGDSLVRTILSIDEEKKSMTFAGDIPEGSTVYLMRSDNDELTSGAEHAGKAALDMHNDDAELAILVSCVGRKLVMNQWVEDEIEVIRDTLGDDTFITGFYSYGELAPMEKGGNCHLHNQTMTLTLLSEN